MTYVNSNGHEAYDDGRSKALQAAANKRYRQSSRESYAYLKAVCDQLGMTPSELINQTNVNNVAAIISAALSEERGETT